MSEGDEREGLDDPMFTPRPVSVPERRSWWLLARGWRSAVLVTVGWFAIFVIRIVDVLSTGHSSVVSTVLLVISGVLALAYVPSIVHFVRLRRDESSISD